ncbi:uncharacterized protein LOC116844617 isoform X2 [Odontomachus brunneus]|uniref:uncharacterized protein LOC116844617 isoform X2 n=1 Tax=Odontomachus brunneus TaxID=486640 RepID=UPI0013F26CAC|nr:uncharacterized protein LOC116844617 isoform X2 [Odontomachus brunneus]
MEAHARAPDPLTNVGNMTNNWHSWIEDFIIFMKVTGYIDKPNEIRANLLKNRIGKVGIDVIQNMSFDNPQDKDDMDIIVKKLEEHFNPPKNEVIERYQFFTKCKNPNQTIEQYINNLKEKAKTCNFKEMTDSLIRDRIILDTNDKILRKKYFEASNLDLQKLVAIYNDYHTNIEKMKLVSQENQAESTSSIKSKPIDHVVKGCCWRCGLYHPQKKCPAWGSKCTKCGDVNHFTQCCRGLKPNPNNSKAQFFMPQTNKNILDPMQPQAKNISKRNEELRNNSADSSVTITITDPTSETKRKKRKYPCF